ncbi:CBS domain-containing protein, partial [Streptomyces galilaeus]|uniref:hypothetical protein n=1 Tax=Streptomyces galilaeus TaxID=33899 RepID=UPI0038F65221
MRELYQKRPISALMIDRPLVVDVGAGLDDIARALATDHPEALVHGFVITRDGRYAGIGTANGFMRRQVAQAEQRGQ